MNVWATRRRPPAPTVAPSTCARKTMPPDPPSPASAGGPARATKHSELIFQGRRRQAPGRPLLRQHRVEQLLGGRENIVGNRRPLRRWLIRRISAQVQRLVLGTWNVGWRRRVERIIGSNGSRLVLDLRGRHQDRRRQRLERRGSCNRRGIRGNSRLFKDLGFDSLSFDSLGLNGLRLYGLGFHHFGFNSFGPERRLAATQALDRRPRQIVGVWRNGRLGRRSGNGGGHHPV